MSTLRIPDLVRPGARAARSTITRLFHPMHRRKAERALGELDDLRSVLFLCTGNICRSPYAEKAFRRALPTWGDPAVLVTSAGFLEPLRQPPEPAVRVAAERGIQLGGHRSRNMSGETLGNSDLVVGMEAKHLEKVSEAAGSPGAAILLGDLDPQPPLRREIRDPWGHPDAVFLESFERIDRCIASLGEALFGSLEER